MHAPTAPHARSSVHELVARTTMQSILGLEQSHLDQVMATAYLLYQAGRYREVDVLCKGLIAADQKYWWSYSLHAAALRRLGRLTEALQQIEHGLSHEPHEPKLLLMRGEIVAAIGAWRDRAEAQAATTNTSAGA